MTSINHNFRLKLFVYQLIILSIALVLFSRQFYWQVLKSSELKNKQLQQLENKLTISGYRGNIYTSDQYLLAGNKISYKLILDKNNFFQSISKLIDDVLNLKNQSRIFPLTISEKSILKDKIYNKIEKQNWPELTSNLNNQEVEFLKKKYPNQPLFFEPIIERYYPEASMAASLLGFVGKNQQGEQQGYFGIEGGLNKEISGLEINKKIKTNALGQILLDKETSYLETKNGRDIYLTIRRDIQFLVEKELGQAINQYQAKSGEVIVVEPSTGKILALASIPNFYPYYYNEFDSNLYRQPSFSDLYEPGSTFKVLTVAVGLDLNLITPQTICTLCSGPRIIGNHTIKTWNNQYNLNITIEDGLAKSDNTAMIFVVEKIGKDKFLEYIHKFGIGEPVNLPLQGNNPAVLPNYIGPVELATISFGQGISLTSLQLIRAINSIANLGKRIELKIIEKVIDPNTGEIIFPQENKETQVIKTETAKTITTMMVKATNHGEAQRLIKNHKIVVAGKTGTSQIPSKTGGYLEDQTIASFIGFTPPDQPKFIMFVKLVAPQLSPWASETAFPLWQKIAEKLLLII